LALAAGKTSAQRSPQLCKRAADTTDTPDTADTDTDTDTDIGTPSHPYFGEWRCVHGLVRRSLSQSLKIDYKRLHNQSQNQCDFLTVIVFLVLYSNFCPYDHECGPDADGWSTANSTGSLPFADYLLATHSTHSH